MSPSTAIGAVVVWGGGTIMAGTVLGVLAAVGWETVKFWRDKTRQRLARERFTSEALQLALERRADEQTAADLDIDVEVPIPFVLGEVVDIKRGRA